MLMNDKKYKVRFAFELVLTFVVAFVLRLTYIFELKDADPTFYYPVMDARWHWQWAMGIVQGDFWGKEVFFRAPLYPYFLALLIWAFNADFFAIRVLQAVLGSLTAVAIHLLGFKLAGRRNGMLSGLLCASYGTLIYFDGEFLTEVLYLPLLFWSLLCLLLAYEKGKIPLWLVSGLLFGLSAITRPNNLVCVPFLLGCLLWEKRNKKQLKSIVLWLTAFALPVTAVTVRNGIVGGEYVLIASQGGINFYIGNNPEADGKTAINPVRFDTSGSPSLYQDSVAFSSRMYAQKMMGRKLTEGEVSSYWYTQAFSYIKHFPLQWAKLMLKKIYFFVNGYEIPSNREIYRVREWASVLRFTMVKEPFAFPYGLIFPLAMVGTVIAWGTIKEKNISLTTNRLLTLYIISYSTTVIGFFVTARHRIPVVPALLPYASFSLLSGVSAIARTYNFLRRRKTLSDKPISARCAVYLLIFLLAFLVSNSRFVGVRDDKTREFYIGLGEVYGRQGKWLEAEREFKKAVTVDPQIDRGWYGLGVVYVKMKRYDDALKAFENTLKLNPYFAEAYTAIGSVYMGKRDYETAERFYRKALEIKPCLAVAHHNLASVLRLGKNDLAGYENELATAVKCDPYFVPALLDMAHILIYRDRIEEGEELIKRVLVVEPKNERAKQYLSLINEKKKLAP